ncbi:DUF4258 domain-containing protein [Archangium sp.]|uniref:DUF4258 domain-containing protein n=1 Tax=Archangium sp. TaxID=1872627 RepID=UPI002D2346EF|nr:DUF4258 domain-containing protein [Archangium sp.]HYO53278.1 DUF4258 domain-containing protein [Archangium sp.]
MLFRRPDRIITLTRHAEEELAKDELTTLHAEKALLSGRILEEPELVNGTWRYRVHTEQMVVVVAFVSESKLRIITAWRKKK